MARSTQQRAGTRRPTSSRPGSGRARSTAPRRTSAPSRPPRSPRSMRRMAILGVVAVFLAVLITPTLHSYLQRRGQISQLRHQVAAQQKDVATKQAQLKKWNDPKYVEAQARSRLGFAKPGSTLTIVVDKNNVAHQAGTTGNGVSVRLPWYGRIWQSAVNADHHPGSGR